jgi:eukaryotic-like serine/threonine-protein kinase
VPGERDRPRAPLTVADAPIADFGIARGADATALTGSGAVISTLRYMSPSSCSLQEQHLRPRAVLVRVATGHDPFPGPATPAVITRILTGPPALGLLAGDLRDILVGCLAPVAGW